MQKYLPADIEAGKALDRARCSRHRNVSHALAGLGAEAGHHQFIVAPDGAIEEHERGASKARLQLGRDMGAGGDEIEVSAGGLVADAEAERVARAVIAAGMGLAFQIPGAL